MSKLDPKAFALAFGILWAVGMFLLVLMSLYLNWGNAIVELMGSGYLGVDVSLKGAFLALPWAFVDAFIGGYVFAWLYNKFL